MEKIHDNQRLKEMQNLPLERKVGFSLARIVEWYTHYRGGYTLASQVEKIQQFSFI